MFTFFFIITAVLSLLHEAARFQKLLDPNWTLEKYEELFKEPFMAWSALAYIIWIVMAWSIHFWIGATMVGLIIISAAIHSGYKGTQVHRVWMVIDCLVSVVLIILAGI